MKSPIPRRLQTLNASFNSQFNESKDYVYMTVNNSIVDEEKTAPLTANKMALLPKEYVTDL